MRVRYIKGILTSILMIMTTVLIFIDQSEALTLEEAVRIGLENNHRIRQYREFIDAQHNRVESNKSAFFPKINLGYSFRRQDSVFSFFQPKEESVLYGEITYNLFNGFSDLMALRESRAVLDSKTYELNALVADIKLQIKKAYIEYLRAKRSLEIAREAVALLEKQLKDARAYYREGMIAKNDLLKVEVELASERQRETLAEAQLKIARMKLERLIGVSLIDDEIREIITEEGFHLNQDLLLKEMLQKRSELKYLKALKRVSELKAQAIKGGYFPTVDLSLTHERYGDSYVPDGRAGLFDTQSRALVIARWNIFDGFKKKYDIEAEISEMRAIEEEIKDTEEELKLQLTTALENLRTALSRLNVARLAVEQAKENYRITENRFRQRMATTTDLLDARFFLTRAENDLKNAEYDYYLSIAEIERVVEKEI